MAVGLFSHKVSVSDPAELDGYLATAELPVLVEFAERDSPACQIEGPIVEELGRRYGDRLKVVKADVRDSPGLVAHFKVQAVPTFVLFVDGHERLRLLGFQDIEDLAGAVDGVLAPPAPPA